MINGYRRVSRKGPCRICGRSDWCSTTWNHTISFCARAVTYADRVSRNGWGIYYHDIKRGVEIRYSPSRKHYVLQERNPIAPIGLRNEVYQTLIHLSRIATCDSTLSRDKWAFSFRTREWERFGLFPKTTIKRHRLVRSLVDTFVKHGKSVPTFIGVPGFWQGSNESLRLGSDFDFVDDLLLIPFYDSNGLIRACQMRCLGNVPNKVGKYLWLSSVKQPNGCGPGTPLHHEGAVNYKGKTIRTVLVTEGALKAATVQTFLPDRYVVGNSGVATSHQEIVRTARKKDLEIAFDADCVTNPHVARSLASLIALRTREQRFLSYDRPIRIITWDKRYKGIDDALIAGATLKHLNVAEWLTSLTPDCFESARHQLAGISL